MVTNFPGTKLIGTVWFLGERTEVLSSGAHVLLIIPNLVILCCCQHENGRNVSKCKRLVRGVQNNCFHLSNVLFCGVLETIVIVFLEILIDGLHSRDLATVLVDKTLQNSCPVALK